MRSTLVIDLNKSIRSGECYYKHPDPMKMNDDGTPKLLVSIIATERHRVEAEQAIEVCPARAISLIVD